MNDIQLKDQDIAELFLRMPEAKQRQSSSLRKE